MIYGTLKKGRLHLEIDGVAVSPSEVIPKQLITFVPQHPHLPTSARVRDIIPIYFSQEKKQDAVFYDPGVAKITARKMSELSVGERKYFEVVLAGNLESPFLFLDEPFSMLEPLQTEAIKNFLNTLQADKGILITDHYYTDVLDITTQNIVIKEGISHSISSARDLQQFDYLSKKS